VIGNVTTEMILAILPEISLLILAGIVLLMDVLWDEERRRGLGWLTAAGLGAILVISLAAAQPGADREAAPDEARVRLDSSSFLTSQGTGQRRPAHAASTSCRARSG